jgi:hypothetical protein
MRDYGKVHTRFWSSDTIRGLTDDGRLLAMYLMTSPHSTIAGVFRLPDGYVCEDMQWTPERVAQGFAELFAKGFGNRCETSKWVWVTKHLEWNPPENPNQRKSAAKVALSVPDECAWKLDFMRVCGPSLGIETPQKPNPSLTVVKPFPNQEQEQEQEQDKKQPSPAKLPTCPYEDIVALYLELLPELPAVRVMDDDRKRGIRKRWDWVMTTKKPDGSRRAESAESAMAWFRSYFELARDNDFLMGRTKKAGEHASWKCDIDFLMTTKGLKQVLERTEAA